MALAWKSIASLRSALIALALVLTLVSSMAIQVRPAIAATSGQISTRNIILGALAATAGIILYNNYQRKHRYANSIVGYTRDGGTVYGDGRVVYPNGAVLYASNNGATPCTFDGEGAPCSPYRTSAYFPRGYHPSCWPPGHCKHQRDRDGDNDDNE